MPATSSDLNSAFFDGLYKDVWKQIIPNGLTEVEVEFIAEAARLAESSHVLDMMCGYGRHALALGRKNIPVTAVDNQPDYIEEIRGLAGAENLPVQARACDILSFETSTSYDAVICMGNSFSFFDRDNTQVLLKKIHDALKPGGFFIMNSWAIAEVVNRYFKEKDWHYAGPYKCVLEFEYHPLPARVSFEQTVIAPSGVIEVQKGVDYIYSLNEFDLMFREAGLEILHVYSTPKKRKFTLGDGRAYIVAQKRPGA